MIGPRFEGIATDDLLAEVCRRVPRTAQAVAAVRPIATVVRPETDEEYAAYLDLVVQVMTAAADDRKRFAAADVMRALIALGGTEGDASWAVVHLYIHGFVREAGPTDMFTLRSVPTVTDLARLCHLAEAGS